MKLAAESGPPVPVQAARNIHWPVLVAAPAAPGAPPQRKLPAASGRWQRPHPLVHGQDYFGGRRLLPEEARFLFGHRPWLLLAAELSPGRRQASARRPARQLLLHQTAS